MLELAIKIFAKLGESISFDCLTNISHQMQIVMQIMDGIKVITEDLPGLEKMSQIGSTIISAGIAGTFFVKRFMIIAKPGILNGKFPL